MSYRYAFQILEHFRPVHAQLQFDEKAGNALNEEAIEECKNIMFHADPSGLFDMCDAGFSALHQLIPDGRDMRADEVSDLKAAFGIFSEYLAICSECADAHTYAQNYVERHERESAAVKSKGEKK